MSERRLVLCAALPPGSGELSWYAIVFDNGYDLRGQVAVIHLANFEAERSMRENPPDYILFISSGKSEEDLVSLAQPFFNTHPSLRDKVMSFSWDEAMQEYARSFGNRPIEDTRKVSIGATSSLIRLIEGMQENP